jgi:hypothetical protein
MKTPIDPDDARLEIRAGPHERGVASHVGARGCVPDYLAVTLDPNAGRMRVDRPRQDQCQNPNRQTDSYFTHGKLLPGKRVMMIPGRCVLTPLFSVR